MKQITSFKGKHQFLSNFYPARLYWDRFYPTAEHAYQASKTPIRADKIMIAELPTPGKAKRAGRNVALYPEWEEVKIQVMQGIVQTKFGHNIHLMNMLAATEDAYLLEGNYWHDNFWGSCSCEKCKHIQWHNHLGKILMNVRFRHEGVISYPYDPDNYLA